jgi:hypothetical protein
MRPTKVQELPRGLNFNAFILAQHLPDAQLLMYPDASHGAQSQHAGGLS